MSVQCKCKKGYMSAHDGKCGKCRSKKESANLNSFFKELELLEDTVYSGRILKNVSPKHYEALRLTYFGQSEPFVKEDL